MGQVHFLARGVPNIFRERARLREWLLRVAQEHGQDVLELSFVLLSDEALMEINRRFLGHDDFTDVITFDLSGGVGVRGEVLMSLPRIRDNANVYCVPQQQELRRVMVHGLLHLLGHSDKKPSERKAMTASEDACLRLY
ncbi:MAG: rRNA maturation RNase YbeY [Flavobacteriales bacterium]|jgi:rRNA maturation RNase YbeY|nr:rRNA maturation RNase YbeY [Flavobacteriales bacterium]